MPETNAPTLSLIGLLLTLGLGSLFLVLPRRFAVFPLIASACFITLGQTIVVANIFHFTSFRIVILVGWLRLLVRHELSLSTKFNIMDKLIIVYASVGFILPIILFGTLEALIAQSGFIYNLIGIYFLFRFLIRDYEDMEKAVKILGLCLIPLAGFMIVEMSTGRNMFSALGGVPEFSAFRDGQFRCQGPFRHPILAGSLGAVSTPLLIGLLGKQENRRWWAILSIIASTAIVIASHSSGPALAYGFGLIGLGAWLWRRKMRLIRWAILTSLILLHLIMKAPVWYLMDRISGLIGGGGWHRAYLIDQAIKHIDEWWLLGTKSTADWMPYTLAIDPNAADITNQFIVEGVTGGLLRMGLFICIIVTCFIIIGSRVRKLNNVFKYQAFLIWGLGASLLAHVTSFFSVSYFDQMTLFWYMLLAFIVTSIPSSRVSENITTAGFQYPNLHDCFKK